MSLNKKEEKDRQKLYDLTLGEMKSLPEYELDKELIGNFCSNSPYKEIKKHLKNFNKDKVYEAAEKFRHHKG